MKFAVCTMSYNEDISLPLWVKYYGRVFGRENLYVFDHGSNDGSTLNLGDVNVIKLPRTPFSDAKRSRLITDFGRNLLNFFDYFIYTDTDEFLCVDPSLHGDLRHYLLESNVEYETAIGINLFHRRQDDDPINLSRPLLPQRPHGYFLPAMCKTLVTRTPLNWGGGFHCCDKIKSFGAIYNFHLKQMDYNLSLDRLRFLRKIPRDGSFGGHQVWDDKRQTDVFNNVDRKGLADGFDFSENVEEMKSAIERLHDGRYGLPRDFRTQVSSPLRRIPEQFYSVF